MADLFQLHRNPLGQLVLTGTDGREHVGVKPWRAFPISAPQEGVAVLGGDGAELAWIPRLAELPEELKKLLEEELAGYEFMPEILRVRGVSGYATPCTWRVDTDRGAATLLLKAEEDIRRLSGFTLLIVDGHGIQFLIRDSRELDATSRRIIDRFS
jgi:hypothetical protein